MIGRGCPFWRRRALLVCACCVLPGLLPALAFSRPVVAITRPADQAVLYGDTTVEVAFRLGGDPRKADQMVPGTVNLPHGHSQHARVQDVPTRERATQADACGAGHPGQSLCYQSDAN